MARPIPDEAPITRTRRPKRRESTSANSSNPSSHFPAAAYQSLDPSVSNRWTRFGQSRTAAFSFAQSPCSGDSTIGSSGRTRPVSRRPETPRAPLLPHDLGHLSTSSTSLPRAPLYLEHLSTSSTSISTNQHKSAQISTNSAALAQGEIDLDSHRRPQDRRQERISQASPGPSPNTGIMSLMECRGGAPRVGYAKDRLMSIRPKHRDHRGPPISSSASSPSKQQKPGGDSRKASKCPVSASRRSTGHFGSVNPILLVRVRLPALRRDAPDSRTPAGLCGRASPVDLERMSPP